MNHGQIFVLAIIAISTFGGILRMWVKARHGYPIEDRGDRRGKGSDIDAERRVALLSAENDRLTGQIGRLEERIAVLERIATDPAERVSREIDALR
jgi:hypothetical protein